MFCFCVRENDTDRVTVASLNWSPQNQKTKTIVDIWLVVHLVGKDPSGWDCGKDWSHGDWSWQ